MSRKQKIASRIRRKYPGAYDDLTDNQLIELYQKKFDDFDSYNRPNYFKYVIGLIGGILSLAFVPLLFLTSEDFLDAQSEILTNYLKEPSDFNYYIAKLCLPFINSYEKAMHWSRELKAIAAIIGVILISISFYLDDDNK
jgi:hypothetical protein